MYIWYGIILSCLPPSSLLPSLLLTTRYYYPRQVLIPHFWTPSQQVVFRGVYHRLRAEHHMPVLQEMRKTSSLVQDGHLQNRLLHLCAKVSQSLLNLVFLSVIGVPLLPTVLYLVFVKGVVQTHRTYSGIIDVTKPLLMHHHRRCYQRSIKSWGHLK